MASKNLTTTKRGKRTVNVDNTSRTNSTVSVLFKSRTGMRFDLSNGHSIHLNGNAVHLVGARGGVLPVGGYTVNTVDAQDWELCKAEWGGVFKPWFDQEIIKEESNEKKAIDEAFERAEEKTGDDPIDLSAVEDKE